MLDIADTLTRRQSALRQVMLRDILGPRHFGNKTPWHLHCDKCLTDTSDPGHFGTKTFRHWCGSVWRTLRPQCQKCPDTLD